MEEGGGGETDVCSEMMLERAIFVQHLNSLPCVRSRVSDFLPMPKQRWLMLEHLRISILLGGPQYLVGMAILKFHGFLSFYSRSYNYFASLVLYVTY